MIKVAVVMGKMHSGGKKNLVMEYYRHIDRTKVQFDFICDSDSNAIPRQEIESLGGSVILVPPYQQIIRYLLALGKTLKSNRYQIVHGYNSTMNVFAMLVAKKEHVPIRINESISMGHRNDKRNIVKNILKPFSTLCSTHLMANGVECGRWQFGNKKYEQGKVVVFKTVIDSYKNRFDKQLRERCRKTLGIDNCIVIGHIGRFSAQKNTLFVIDITSEILKKEPRAILLIIGHGELEEEMNNRIREKGIEEKVLNLGKREDIQQFYNAMDCFILPSLYEGLPVSGVEAECCGLPVFFSSEVPKESSPCDDLGYFINLNNDASRWADIIIENTRNHMKSRRDRSAEIIEAGFDSGKEANRLCSFYEAITTGAIKK